MVNFIGRLPPLADALAIEGAHYHDYGKTARPNRKLGPLHGGAREPGAATPAWRLLAN
jgi:phosphoribosylaminoimidazole carboxylase (NCAIR synthetase)